MKTGIIRRLLSISVAFILMAAWAPPVFADDDSSEMLLPFRDLSAEEITSEMGVGWNLGNTLDGHTGFLPSETLWQNTITTQKLIDSVHDAGFNTIRLPVTWGLKIDDENNYTIDAAWLSRVQDIADYCIAQDMYVIINIHHDGAEQAGWLSIAAEGDELETVKAKFARVWEQISEVFRGYDEHLLFESMNEVTGGDNKEASIMRDFRVIEELNQIFVDQVRGTGGNNTRRWLLCPGRYTNITNTTNEKYGFELPEDEWNEENRLMVSVHDYDYSFGMVETLGVTNWSEQNALKMGKNFQKLIDSFTSKGIPVVLGEYGAVNKNNPDARAYYYEVIARLSSVSGVVCCAWDQGWYDSTLEPDYSFTLFDRTTGISVFKQVTDAIMRGYFLKTDGDSTAGFPSVIMGTDKQSVIVTPFESIIPEKKTLSMIAGSSVMVSVFTEPESANDVLLYKSSDPSVATVYNGLVRARGIGSCTISVVAQSGGAESQITVFVYPDKSLKSPVTQIETDAEAYQLEPGEVQHIAVSGIPSDTDDSLSFFSSNTDVITVNKLGKLVGINEGSSYVTITARSGFSKTVRVDVGKPAYTESELELGLYVYFNDSDHEFFGFCMGDTVKVNGDGSYVLSFDSAENLTDEAKKSGVSLLENLGAIYIADTAAQSNKLSSCNIYYDAVTVDDTPLTVTMTKPKSAIKPNTKFDTNDPVNAWDGSAVAEVSVEDYVINFTLANAPSKITVEFTLSDFALYNEVETGDEFVKAETISLSDDLITTESPEHINVSASISPANTSEKITFISEDESVAWVSPVSMSVDKNGIAYAEIVPVGSGSTTVIVMTESGLSAVLSVESSWTPDIIDGTLDETVLPVLKATPVPVKPTATPVPADTNADDVTADATKADEEAGDGQLPNKLLLNVLAILTGIGILTAAMVSVLAFVTRQKKVEEVPIKETIQPLVMDEKAKAAEASADRRGKAINTSIGNKGKAANLSSGIVKNKSVSKNPDEKNSRK